ncbi:hypothetical protein [Candidatus Chlorobium masyuteum]|uniref:hypothetical protein n=1 Tax=Candidatus Chlorobium masyuteum TaxID=2716876 RepID=UPI00142046EE|nr:hypothetical protein [Candidatus Chlorobium masyuteum]
MVDSEAAPHPEHLTISRKGRKQGVGLSGLLLYQYLIFYQYVIPTGFEEKTEL